MKYSTVKDKIRIRVSGLMMDGDTVLMVCHKKHDSTYWLLPGGGVNFGESLADAVKREFREEVGITVDVGDVIFVSDAISPSGKRHIVNIAFFCTFVAGKYRLGNDKRLFDFDFFDREQIKDLLIYPPFTDELIRFMDDQFTERVYLGSKWNK
ncbi:MAG: NUDIX domain-containing protein [Spirochaetota bacterium]